MEVFFFIIRNVTGIKMKISKLNFYTPEHPVTDTRWDGKKPGFFFLMTLKSLMVYLFSPLRN